MLTQINLMDVGYTIAHYLRDNEKVKSFCEEQFGAQPKFIVGPTTRQQIPTRADCPYIVIADMQKREGLRRAVNGYVEYTAHLYVGVSTTTREITESDHVYANDGADVCSMFMEVIEEQLNERADRSRPLDQAEVSVLGAIETDGSHWVGEMNLRWQFPQSINTNYMEEF